MFVVQIGGLDLLATLVFGMQVGSDLLATLGFVWYAGGVRYAGNI